MGARDLLAQLADAGVTVAADGDRLVIRPASRLTEDMRSALRTAKPQLLQLLAAQPRHRLTAREADAAHAQPWDEAACSRFSARVTRLLRLGVDAEDADDLAERLHLRDIESDTRRCCLECAGLSGHAASGWKCQRARLANVSPALPDVLVTLLQRCPGFSDGLHGQTTGPRANRKD